MKELLRALDWQHATGSPMGIIQALLRDLFPAFVQLGLHELVIVLDGHLPPVALLGPERAAAAVTAAVNTLGADTADRLRSREKLTSGALLDLLRAHVEAGIATETSGQSFDVKP